MEVRSIIILGLEMGLREQKPSLLAFTQVLNLMTMSSSTEVNWPILSSTLNYTCKYLQDQSLSD